MMRLIQLTRLRLTRLAVTATVLGSLTALVAAAPSASAASAAGPTGWIRIAHLSPQAPPMDMYVYPFGDPGHPTVLKDVRYGAVSRYVPVTPGQYSVAMRGFGAPATSKPALTKSFMVTAGGAFTLAALGPDPGLRTEVLKDQLNAPAGKAVVRVLQASLKQHRVTVSYGMDVLAQQLAFGSATAYTPVRPGAQTVRFTAPGEQASQAFTVTADSAHTFVVLDNPGGFKVTALTDAAGSAAMPEGGVAAGFGGTAPHPASPAPWLALIAAGALLAGAGLTGAGLARRRLRPGASSAR
jgi:hypothetical protein